MTRVRQLLTVSVPCQYSGLHPHEVTVTTDEHGLVLGVRSDCDRIDPGVDEVGVALVGRDYACCRYMAAHVLAAVRDLTDEGPIRVVEGGPLLPRMTMKQLERRMPPLLYAITSMGRSVAAERRRLRERRDKPRPWDAPLRWVFPGRAQFALRKATHLPLHVKMKRVDRGYGTKRRLVVLSEDSGVVLATYRGRGLWSVSGEARLWLARASELTFERGEPCPVCDGAKASLRHLQTIKHGERLEAKFLDALGHIGDQLKRD